MCNVLRRFFYKLDNRVGGMGTHIGFDITIASGGFIRGNAKGG
ncbi:MAG: hypothetical protein P8H28_04075 [Porticoccaceae bacterium]|nr:hypothetical protein [Porticoccaceae bacterium]